MGKKFRLMITSLYDGGSDRELGYYYAKGDTRCMYCDALLQAEASSKYIMANYDLDEIVVLGRKSTYDPGDELVQMVLREGSSFYSADINSMSAYSLLRYRLAQFIDELRIDEKDMMDRLSAEEQEKMVSALKSEFRDCTKNNDNAKFNRFFDLINRDPALGREIEERVSRKIAPDAEDRRRYRLWARNYIYNEMRDSYKLELLEGNENVTIRFIPIDEGGPLSFADTLIDSYSYLFDEDGEPVDIELFICIQSENADDSFALINFMDIVKSLPESRLVTKKIVTSSRTDRDFINKITDDTELYGTRGLLSGLRAFTSYGKTDMLMQYWEHHKTDNQYIDRLMYAIRNIDIGISLCDIVDLERGITSLTKLFSEGEFVPGDSIVEQYFALIVEGIREDYRTFLDEDGIQFIDLVKWAYSKGLWQQTLTIIESKAPGDFVANGIYYYADSKESKEKAIRLFGTEFFNMKPFEKYKMDDISHYFIKFYGRWRLPKGNGPDDSQKFYTKQRIQDLDTDEEDIVRGFTLCSDRELLSRLLYSYYHLGSVRNATNHAIVEYDEFKTRMEDSDIGERMLTIRQTVEDFIYMYDRVSENIAGKEKNVITVSNEEIRDFAGTLRREYPKDKRKNDDRSRKK